MKNFKGHTKIRTDETLRETARHGNESFPFCYYYEDIWLFDLHCVDWHWHPEVEFVMLTSGEADFFVGHEKLHLKSGEALFINARVIHRFESKVSAILPNIVFSPALMAQPQSLIFEKYIAPITESSLQYVHLLPSEDAEIIAELKRTFAAAEQSSPSQLQILSHIACLWELMAEKYTPKQWEKTTASAQTQAQLQIMMQFIHENYSQKLTLDDIAGSVSISRSGAQTIFRKYLHIPPIKYLLEYRLKRAAKLLCETENSVISIAGMTGFESSEYFCRKFKELFGVSPGKYRTQSRK